MSTTSQIILVAVFGINIGSAVMNVYLCRKRLAYLKELEVTMHEILADEFKRVRVHIAEFNQFVDDCNMSEWKIEDRQIH